MRAQFVYSANLKILLVILNMLKKNDQKIHRQFLLLQAKEKQF